MHKEKNAELPSILSRSEAILKHMDKSDEVAANAAASAFAYIDLESKDLLNVQFILDTEGANQNRDYMTRSGIIKYYRTAKFKPMNSEHFIEEGESMIRHAKSSHKNTIFGVITDTALCWADGRILTPKEYMELDPTEDASRTDSQKLCVMAYASLWHMLFPKTVSELSRSIASGRMKVSMERLISNYDYIEWNGSEYVVSAASETNQMDRRWAIQALSNGKPILRRSLDFVYSGVGSTTNPANHLSIYHSTNFLKSAASLENKSTLARLIKEHCELHEKFTILTNKEQIEKVINRHTTLTKLVASIVEKEEMNNSIDALDMTLPPGLREAARFTEEAEAAETKESNTMDKDTKLDKAAIAEVVEEITSKNNDKNALASKIEVLMTEKFAAEKAVAEKVDEIKALAEKVGKMDSKMKKMEEAMSEKEKESEAEMKAKTCMAEELESAKAENESFKAKFAELEAEKVVASRTDALKSIGGDFANEKRINRAVARNESGEFKMSNDDFADYIEDVRDLAAIAALASKAEDSTDESAEASTPSEPDLAEVAKATKAIASFNVSADKPAGKNQFSSIGIA